MTSPDFMPVLSFGSHVSPQDGACVMEYVSILAGEPFSDRPLCTHYYLAVMARTVNDSMDQDERHRLLPLIPRLVGTSTPQDVEVARALEMWLAENSKRGNDMLDKPALGSLIAMLDEYDRITGRTETGTLSDVQLRVLAEATAR